MKILRVLLLTAVFTFSGTAFASSCTTTTPFNAVAIVDFENGVAVPKTTNDPGGINIRINEGGTHGFVMLPNSCQNLNYHPAHQNGATIEGVYVNVKGGGNVLQWQRINCSGHVATNQNLYIRIALGKNSDGNVNVKEAYCIIDNFN